MIVWRFAIAMLTLSILGLNIPIGRAATTTILSVSAGDLHTCAVKSDGTVWCWGANNAGQLGNGSYVDSPTPVKVVQISNAKSVSAGATHTCAVLADNTARCWGWNGFGQLGNGTYADSSTPVSVRINATTLLTNVVEISASFAIASAAGPDWTFAGTTCATLSDKSAYCWGWQSVYGQIGDNTYFNRKFATKVLGSEHIGTSTRGFHTCSRRSNYTLYCWGNNGDGQLGSTGAATKPSPTRATTLSTVTSLAVGGWHTCVLLQDKTARCWGYNSSGQLGNGTTTKSTTPVVVTGIASGTVAAAGLEHTCVLLAAGTIYCWGKNVDGRLGTGNNTMAKSPAKVSTITTGKQLTAGGSHTCTVTAGNGVWCWGANGRGQLGDTTFRNSNVPRLVQFP